MPEIITVYGQTPEPFELAVVGPGQACRDLAVSVDALFELVADGYLEPFYPNGMNGAPRFDVMQVDALTVDQELLALYRNRPDDPSLV